MTDLRTRRRFGRYLAAVGIALIMVLAAVPVSAWEYSEFSFDETLRLAMMAEAGKWNPYLDLRGTFHGAETEFRYHALSAGAYYRAAPWLKLGAFYRLQGGVRHLDDWTVALPDNHSWEDVSGRYENLLLADATPRFLLPWLPGENWVGSAKVRYGYNFFNGEQTLLLRPGLTWVLMKEREPVLNLSLQYPVYVALNFNDSPIYGHGPYITALWHLSDRFKMEGRVEFLMKNYSKTAFGGPWILHSRHLGMGLGLIYTPDFGG